VSVFYKGIDLFYVLITAISSILDTKQMPCIENGFQRFMMVSSIAINHGHSESTILHSHNTQKNTQWNSKNS